MDFSQYFPFWSSLTAQQQQLLAQSSQQKTYAAGQMLHDGSECTGLILVLSGQIRVFTISEEGKELTLYRLMAGQMCLLSASCMLQGITFSVMTSAQQDSEVLLIPASVYQQLMQSSAEVANYTNALMASLKADASQIAKYSPLEGWRHEGEEQCGMHINCCNANGPRAFALIPGFAYQAQDDCIRINFYTPSDAYIWLKGKREIHIEQETNYPVEDTIRINIDPKRSTTFALALRIPAWSQIATVSVNGEPQSGVLQGAYYTINRKWEKGDQVCIRLDLRARLVEQNQAQAIVRGPIVLARDSRFNDGFIDETSQIVSKEGYVELTQVEAPTFAWMAFTAPMILGTDLEGNRTPKQVHLCDFASAGNTWDKTQRYRVWLPKTLNVMHTPYKPYNQ